MSQTQPLCILFADVSGSTKLFEQRGDVEARRIIAAVLEALSKVCVSHGGKVIKTIGDEIMCTLPSAMAGVLAACDMQKRVAHDLCYVDNWSFFFDLKILVRTVISKQAYRNAY